jgi:glycosyltransferase involved in cell wall biosynthesis
LLGHADIFVHIAHYLGLVFAALSAVFWIFHALPVAGNILRLPRIKDSVPALDSECPRVSLIFAARDEQEKLPSALATLVSIDYPDLEIIGVDDRSQDATRRILFDTANLYHQLRVIHITELPTGWLGKSHALQQGYENSSGEWLLFTDADVRFRADVLRRAVTLAGQQNLDHLALFVQVEMVGFWEKALITFFGLGFHLANNPARSIDPDSHCYVGVGAFQLVKRQAYEAAGTHRRLAMEVIDDMKLGKIVKKAGFRSGAAIAQDAVVVRWYTGFGSLVHGVTKNFFAGAEYDLKRVALFIAGSLFVSVLPFVALLLASGWIRGFSAIAVTMALAVHAGVALVMRVSPVYALTHPLGAILCSYMMLRSTAVTLRDGGVTWRGTFYPLQQLKRGVV